MNKYLLIFLFSGTIFAQELPKPAWENVNYAGDDQNFHNLDIYLPNDGQKNYPVVVAIYGSAWRSNKNKGLNYIKKILIKPLVDSGFAVASINHRSSSDALFPAQIHDVKAAIRFLRAKAEKYNLDSSFVGITGNSSGGHLAAMAGTTSFNEDMEGDVGPFLDFDSHVDAVVDWYGPTDFLIMDICGSRMNHDNIKSPESSLVGGAIQNNKEKVKAANPITYISKKTPPFLIFHGMIDLTVPYCQSKILSIALDDFGIQNELISVRDGKHGPGVFTISNHQKMVTFFKNQFNK